MKDYFKKLADSVFQSLKPGEHLFFNLGGDDTQFIRFNGSKVRQTGIVENYFLDFSFVLGETEGTLKRGTGQVTLTSDMTEDQKRVQHWITRFRSELPKFAVDPYAELPKNKAKSRVTEKTGKLLSREDAAPELLKSTNGADLAGIYASGKLSRGMANSAGLFHWFETETFSFDYSLFTPKQKAVKSGYAGTEWNANRYSDQIRTSIEQLKLLEKPSKKVERGEYRVYLAPAAVGALIDMFSWGAISEFAIRKSQSSLRYLRSGEKTLSPKFTLLEDFSGGEVPSFNEEGEVAQEKQVLIQKGKLVSTLVHSRTAKEFGIESNGANGREGLRSPVVAKGALKEAEILKRLGTGLYLSNLHYLNWSDEVNGRITGMTRYACFWVENGEIVCPIENLRFDATIFDLFGPALEDFTDFNAYLPDTNTYLSRSLGGSRVPGALLSKMQFTL